MVRQFTTNALHRLFGAFNTANDGGAARAAADGRRGGGEEASSGGRERQGARSRSSRSNAVWHKATYSPPDLDILGIVGTWGGERCSSVCGVSGVVCGWCGSGRGGKSTRASTRCRERPNRPLADEPHRLRARLEPDKVHSFQTASSSSASASYCGHRPTPAWCGRCGRKRGSSSNWSMPGGGGGGGEAEAVGGTRRGRGGAPPASSAPDQRAGRGRRRTGGTLLGRAFSRRPRQRSPSR